MPCYHPLKGYRSRETNPSGKRSIVFNVNQGYSDQQVEVPCGQCIGCRLDRSRQWAIRCLHEASLYENNCFLTLTYNDENLPKDNSLQIEDFQKFMKRLRKAKGKNIRFFHCGEYGENFGRPHYHALIFNYDFKDKKKWKINNGQTLYISEDLQKLWTLGHSSIGDVTFESAAYVARYIMKKMSGEQALHHYNTIDYTTGEILAERRPEYVTMSRRPGVGKLWLEKYQTDVFPDDFVVVNGKKMKPPKYYSAQLESSDPDAYHWIKISRKLAAEQHEENNTRERLDVREYIQKEKLNQLKRNLPND